MQDHPAPVRRVFGRERLVSAGFAVLLSLLAIVAVVTFLQLQSTIATYDELERRAFVLDASQELQSALGARVGAQQGFLITRRESYLRELAGAREAFRARLADARRGLRTLEGDRLLDVVAREDERLDTAFAARLAAMRAAGGPEAARLYRRFVEPRARATTEAVERFVARQQGRFDDRGNRARSRARRAEQILGALLLGALLIGGAVAVAVLRAIERRDRRLGEATRALERAVAEQRHIAGALQSSLLPRELPEAVGPLRLAARYRPSAAPGVVGGDSYDFFAVPGGGHVCFVCDVCGKGPEAGAVTALVRHTARVLAEDDPRPSRVLARLNGQMLSQPHDGRFVTAVVAHLRPDGDRLAVTAALGGHPCPLVVRAGGGVEPLGRPGTVIGGRLEARFHDREAELGPGDALVLYSDGVTEARRDGEIFGDARLAAVLAGCAGCGPVEIAERIERAVAGFEGAAPRDDLAILVVALAPTVDAPEAGGDGRDALQESDREAVQ